MHRRRSTSSERGTSLQARFCKQLRHRRSDVQRWRQSRSPDFVPCDAARRANGHSSNSPLHRTKRGSGALWLAVTRDGEDRPGWNGQEHWPAVQRH